MNDSLTQSSQSSPSASVYNSSLLFAFFANVFQLISVGLLYRYSDFVNLSGGDAYRLGLITGLAMLGAILFRLVQGVAIDVIGPQKIWLGSLALQFIALLWHTKIDSVAGIEVFLARGLMAMGIAGSFGAWLSFVSLQAPKHRVAEVIGVVGSSGFVGMAIGPAIGDWIYLADGVTRENIDRMFQTASFMIVLSFISTIFATWFGKSVRHGSIRNNTTFVFKNPLSLVWRQNPGFILVLGMIMGMTIGFPGNFLRPLAASLDIQGIKVFFLVYNITAFVTRLTFRRAPQHLGLTTTITLGYSFFVVSLILFMFAKTENGFWLPALLGGLGHSFLFPSLIAKCTGVFQQEDRGVASSLVLAMYDLGILFGMPMIGKIISDAESWGLESYPAALTMMCLIIFTGTLTHLIIDKRATAKNQVKV